MPSSHPKPAAPTLLRPPSATPSHILHSSFTAPSSSHPCILPGRQLSATYILNEHPHHLASTSPADGLPRATNFRRIVAPRTTHPYPQPHPQPHPYPTHASAAPTPFQTRTQIQASIRASAYQSHAGRPASTNSVIFQPLQSTGACTSPPTAAPAYGANLNTCSAAPPQHQPRYLCYHHSQTQPRQQPQHQLQQPCFTEAAQEGPNPGGDTYAARSHAEQGARDRVPTVQGRSSLSEPPLADRGGGGGGSYHRCLSRSTVDGGCGRMGVIASLAGQPNENTARQYILYGSSDTYGTRSRRRSGTGLSPQLITISDYLNSMGDAGGGPGGGGAGSKMRRRRSICNAYACAHTSGGEAMVPAFRPSSLGRTSLRQPLSKCLRSAATAAGAATDVFLSSSSTMTYVVRGREGWDGTVTPEAMAVATGHCCRTEYGLRYQLHGATDTTAADVSHGRWHRSLPDRAVAVQNDGRSAAYEQELQQQSSGVCGQGTDGGGRRTSSDFKNSYGMSTHGDAGRGTYGELRLTGEGRAKGSSMPSPGVKRKKEGRWAGVKLKWRTVVLAVMKCYGPDRDLSYSADVTEGC